MSATGAVISKAFALAHPTDLGKPGVGVLCTGPFKLVPGRAASRSCMQRYDGYWRKAGLPKIAKLTFKIIPDADGARGRAQQRRRRRHAVRLRRP